MLLPLHEWVLVSSVGYWYASGHLGYVHTSPTLVLQEKAMVWLRCGRLTGEGAGERTSAVAGVAVAISPLKGQCVHRNCR